MSDSQWLKASDFKDEEGTDSTEESVEEPQEGAMFLADSQQPKDLFTQLDSTVRDMNKRFSGEPYGAPIYQLAVQNIPAIDPLTKTKLAQGDTEHFKEVYGIPAMHFLNQYLFNYPRAIAAKMGYEYPESKTSLGGALSKGAGVYGAIKQFQTGYGLAKKALPLKPLAGATGLKTAARGAVAGAAQGAIMSPEDPLDMKARLQQATVGGVVGALIAPVSDKIATFIRKKKMRKITTLKSRVSRRRADVDLDRTQQNIRADETIDEATTLLKQSQKELQDTVATQQVRGKVPKLKTASVEHGKNLNKLYETTVNDISSEIGESTSTLGAADFFRQFADDIGADEGLKATAAFKKISGFADDISDDMSFGDLNRMRHALSKKPYRGDIDDVVYTRFRQAFNEFAETVDSTGKFARLNKTMGPQLEFKHTFNKKINTFKKYETGGGEKLVKKYAQRNTHPEKITQGEIDLMDDAMMYFKKYGVETSDIEALYSGRAADVAKVQRVSDKIAALSKKEGATRTGETAIRKSFRQKQTAKIDDINMYKARRLVANAANTVVRLSLAGAALYGFNQMREAIGMSGGGGKDSAPGTAVQ